MIRINNTSFSGNNIVINGNKIIIDGKDVTPDSKEIIIMVNANIETLRIDYANNIKVVGNIGSIQTSSGDVNIDGDVTGSIQTSSGDVDCGNVSGNINTSSGDIKHRKK